MLNREQNKFNQEGPKASNFVVDLREQLKQIERKKEQEEKKIDKVFENYQRNFQERIKKTKTVAKKSLSFYKKVSIKVFLKKLWLSNLFIFGMARGFVGLCNYTGRVFYKFCYNIGWITAFISKFIYLLLHKLTISPAKAFAKEITNYKLQITNIFLNKKFLLIKKLNSLFEIRNYNFEIFQNRPKYNIKSLKSAFTFAILLLIIIFPFKAFTYYKSLDLDNLRYKILNSSQDAVKGMMAGTKAAANLNFNEAQEKFTEATGKFFSARQELDKVSGFLLILASLAPDKDLRLAADAKTILDAGEEAAQLGNHLSLALSPVSICKAEEDESKDDCSLSAILDNFIAHGEQAIKTSHNLKDLILKIDEDNLPENYGEQFKEVKDKASALEGGMSEFINLVKDLRNFLGVEQNKRYLLVFQNNSELRASGGFIGSYALVDFKNGKITNIEAPGGGSYDTEGGLKERVIAPKPLHLVNPLWHFWDANWWPDWPTSAKKLMWFYEKSDGPTVDGIIAITPNVVEDLLKIIGPIDMTENYEVIVTADNFWMTTQEFAERKPAETKQPKKFIGDLMDKIVEELPRRIQNDKIVDLIKVAGDNLSGKQVLFYFNDEQLEKKIKDFGWGGEMKSAKRDYLSVINTNIAGGKSDRRIKEKITHSSEVQANGEIIDTLEVERVHTGIKREPFSGVRNVDWMRLYVPKGSELLAAEGFEKPDAVFFGKPEEDWSKDPQVALEEGFVRDHESGTIAYEEGDHTVFANWSMVDPGQSVKIRLKYKLPFLINIEGSNNGLTEKIKELFGQKKLFAYSLFVQKQPGASASEFTSLLKLPEEFKMVWGNLNGKEGDWEASDQLNEDKYWTALFEISQK